MRRSFLKRLAGRRSFLFGGLAVGAVAGGILALVLAWRPAIAPIDPPVAQLFSARDIERGAELASIGDCAVCHTATGGRSFAGGRALPTPFGTIYSSNLTPDVATGLGAWSFEAFRRAMREGVRRDGAHLYPAFPYDHYTHVREGDLRAIYAFLMTRMPEHAPTPENNLILPLGFRPLLAGWKLLFLHKGPVPYDPAQSFEWNRGAYLAEGLAHCGACHSLRNAMGAEELSHAYAGGLAEGWRAPPLNGSNPAAVSWNEGSLVTFLRQGISPEHSAAAGPMGPVVEGLSNVPEADVRAIAVYIASKMGRATSAAARLIDNVAGAGQAFPKGARLFEGACAGCHAPGAPMLGQGRPSLGLASDLRDPVPLSAIQAVLTGIEPPVAHRGPKMPPFADSLTDAQVAEVLGYARARFTNQPTWPALERAVSKAREQTQP